MCEVSVVWRHVAPFLPIHSPHFKNVRTRKNEGWKADGKKMEWWKEENRMEVRWKKMGGKND